MRLLGFEKVYGMIRYYPDGIMVRNWESLQMALSMANKERYEIIIFMPAIAFPSGFMQEGGIKRLTARR